MTGFVVLSTMNSPDRQVITGVVVVVGAVVVGAGVVLVDDDELVVGAGVLDVVGNAKHVRSTSSLPSQSADEMFNLNQGSHAVLHGAHCWALKLSFPTQVRLT